MKENYQIYLPYQFHWRPHSAGRDAQLPHNKMKTLFLSNMSKSRRLTSTFFPIIAEEVARKQKDCEQDLAKAEPALIAANAALYPSIYGI